MNRNPVIVLVSRGNRAPKANALFIRLAERVSSRLGVGVTPGFLPPAEPNLIAQLRRLHEEGARAFLLAPYSLDEETFIRSGPPSALAACAESMPDAAFETLPALLDDAAAEDAVLDRLLDRIGSLAPPRSAKEIEERSWQIISSAIGNGGSGNPDAERIIRRVVHATGDLAFARSLKIRDGAVAAGISALRGGRNIFADVRMLAAGITRVGPDRIASGIADPDVAAAAKRENSTRAAAAIEKYADFWANGILAVGNAPTALWRLLEMCERGAPPPALVVGLPVGFVGAAEAKAALWESGLPAITNLGRRGGSAAAAAAVNALSIMAEPEP